LIKTWPQFVKVNTKSEENIKGYSQTKKLVE